MDRKEIEQLLTIKFLPEEDRMRLNALLYKEDLSENFIQQLETAIQKEIERRFNLHQTFGSELDKKIAAIVQKQKAMRGTLLQQADEKLAGLDLTDFEERKRIWDSHYAAIDASYAHAEEDIKIAMREATKALI